MSYYPAPRAYVGVHHATHRVVPVEYITPEQANARAIHGKARAAHRAPGGGWFNVHDTIPARVVRTEITEVAPGIFRKREYYD